MSSLPSASPWPVEVLGGGKLTKFFSSRDGMHGSLFEMANGKTIILSATPHITNMSHGEEDTEHTFSIYGGPVSTVFIGEVLPDGSIVQLSGDAWSRTVLDNYDDSSLSSTYFFATNEERDAEFMEMGEYVSGKSYERGLTQYWSGYMFYFFPVGSAWSSVRAWVDGDDLYFSYEQGLNRVFKFDTNTLELEWVAGRGVTVGWEAKQYSKDNWNGRQADFVPYGSVAVMGGYAYWCEVAWKPVSQEQFSGSFIEGNAYIQDQDSSRYVVRRMLLQDPYTIETIWDRTPSGYPNGNHGDVIDWAWANNPSTGRPNMYNADALVNGGQSGTGLWYHTVARDGALYFLHGNSIRKLVVGEQDLQTLLWGQKPWGEYYFEPYDNNLNDYYAPGSHVKVNSKDVRYHRDHLCDVEKEGIPVGNKRLTANRVNQPPNYEGLNTWFWSPALSGDWLYFHNISGSYMPSRINRFNQEPLTGEYLGGFSASYFPRVCRINLSELEKSPNQRVNRTDPQWETIVNSDYFVDAVNRFNSQSRTHLTLSVGNRSFLGNISHLFAKGDAVYFLSGMAGLSQQDVYPDTISVSSSANWDAGGDWVFATRATSDSVFDVVLNFSGDAYQGYTEAHKLPQASMPKVL